jgi:hypothetical protein
MNQAVHWEELMRLVGALQNGPSGIVALFPLLTLLIGVAVSQGCGDTDEQTDRVVKSVESLQSRVDALSAKLDTERKTIEELASKFEEQSKFRGEQDAKLVALTEELRRQADALKANVDAGAAAIGQASGGLSESALAISKQGAEMQTTVLGAVARLDESAAVMARGPELRAKQSAAAAEQALAAGRLSDAVLLVTSAAIANPQDSSHATRLSEIVLQDPAATPESLRAAATTLRALAMQCSGDAVTSVWRSSEALDAKAITLLEQVAAREAELAIAEAKTARESACRELDELASRDFLGATMQQRAEWIQRMSGALEDADSDCAAKSQVAISTLERWQRIVRFDEARSQAETALATLERERIAERAGGTAAAAVLVAAEGALRTIWTTSEAEVGAERWSSAKTLQDRFAKEAETIVEEREKPILSKIEIKVNAALENGGKQRRSNGKAAPLRKRQYQTAIMQVRGAAAFMTEEAAKLTSKNAISKLRTHQVNLQEEIGRLSEAQYESYCAHISTVLRQQIELAKAEDIVSAADALRFASPLYSFDLGSLPGPLAQSFGDFWRYLEFECDRTEKFQLMEGRMTAVKLVREDF